VPDFVETTLFKHNSFNYIENYNDLIYIQAPTVLSKSILIIVKVYNDNNPLSI